MLHVMRQVLSLSCEEELDFVGKVPEETKCPYHGGLLQDPVVGPCGHSFCKTCVDSEMDDVMECPLCSEPVKEPLYPNNFAIAVISQLQVRCHFSPECHEVIPLGELAIHRQTCPRTESNASVSPRTIFKRKDPKKKRL